MFIFLPILYHGIYGIWIWLRGKANVVYYPWAGNWMYVAQRYTGLIAFVYIGSTWRRSGSWASILPENPVRGLLQGAARASNPWMLAVYIIAMIAICWHFAYGVWLFAAKWGITPGETARKRFGYVCRRWRIRAGSAWGWPVSGRSSSRKYANAPENPAFSYQRSGEQRSRIGISQWSTVFARRS